MGLNTLKCNHLTPLDPKGLTIHHYVFCKQHSNDEHYVCVGCVPAADSWRLHSRAGGCNHRRNPSAAAAAAAVRWLSTARHSDAGVTAVVVEPGREVVPVAWQPWLKTNSRLDCMHHQLAAITTCILLRSVAVKDSTRLRIGVKGVM